MQYVQKYVQEFLICIIKEVILALSQGEGGLVSLFHFEIKGECAQQDIFIQLGRRLECV